MKETLNIFKLIIKFFRKLVKKKIKSMFFTSKAVANLFYYAVVIQALKKVNGILLCSYTVGYKNSKQDLPGWLSDSLLQYQCKTLEDLKMEDIMKESHFILYKTPNMYVLKDIKHIICVVNKQTDKMYHFQFEAHPIWKMPNT